MSRAHVYITGMGIVSPVGQGVQQTIDAIESSACGIAPLTRFAAAQHRRLPVGEIDGLDGENQLPRTHRLARLAADEAMAGRHRPPDAVVIGTTTGGMEITEDLLKRRVAQADLLRWHGVGTVAEEIADHCGCTGAVIAISTACSSGAVAVKIALELIRSGRAHRVLAGGADCLCRLTYYGFHALQLLDPEGARPLDANRRGMSLAEGAAMLLLEADASPGTIAAIFGAGLSCDAYHPAAPHPRGRGAQAAMRSAIEDAGIVPGDVTYINLHGTGTVDNDLAEAKAINALFGKALPLVSSVKGAVGHSLGAAGAVETVMAALCVNRGVLPASVGCRYPDPLLKLMPLQRPRLLSVSHVLSNSFGFGGNNAAVVVGGPIKSGSTTGKNPSQRLWLIGSACLTGAGDTGQALKAISAGRPCAGLPATGESLKSVPSRAVRRLGRLCRLALSLAISARDDAGRPDPPDGVFLGTGWGALSETWSFLTELYENGEQFASPTAFVGSVHNAAAGQIAIVLGATGPNVTTSGGNYSFEQALLAACCLDTGDRRSFLVAGVDEHHSTLSPLLDQSVLSDRKPADGGGALCLTRSADASRSFVDLVFFENVYRNSSVIASLIQTLGGPVEINSRYGALMVGIPESRRVQAEEQLRAFLKQTGFNQPVIDYRKWTGEFASASAVAAVLATKFSQDGAVPAALCDGFESELAGRAILILGLGTFVTAVEICSP